MRISISTICHMRELFPAECFTPTPYGSINVQQLHSAQKQDDGSLKIVNNDAFLLTQWLEKGVFSSLEREYLESMIFAVYTKHPKSGDDLLLETYEFKMSYSEGTTPASINGAPLFSKEVLKNNATRFIRQLITFTDTLDNMPENRWITIQLQVIMIQVP